MSDKELLVPVHGAINLASEMLLSIPDSLSDIHLNYARRRRATQFLFAANYAIQEWYDALHGDEDKHDSHS